MDAVKPLPPPAFLLQLVRDKAAALAAMSDEELGESLNAVVAWVLPYVTTAASAAMVDKLARATFGQPRAKQGPRPRRGHS